MKESTLLIGDCRAMMRTLPAGIARTCITSPPYYGLRDYGVEGQIGLEETPELFVAAMVDVFREVRRVLADDGTLWLNLGDSYRGSASGPQGQSGDMADRSVTCNRMNREIRASARGSVAHVAGLKPKDLVGIPWMVAFALRADGWYLRSDIIWHKPNPMPESVTDRPSRSHEYMFLLSKAPRYFYNADAIREPQATLGERHEGRSGYRDDHPSKESRTANVRKLHPLGANKRDVWTVATTPYGGAHFATFPPALIEPCVLAGSAPGDFVLDPFFGSGTTGAVADKHGRRWIGIELNPKYRELAEDRTAQRPLVMP